VEYEGGRLAPFWNQLALCGLGSERDDWRLGHGTVLSCVQGVHNMETLKIGIREFREKLAGYLESGTPLAITRHGQTLGFYIPAQKRSRKAELEAMRAAAKDLDEMIASWSASEDELMEEYKGIRRSAREKRRNAK
jgi:antitoxin (DNA-binding transcriptional repressor) of toxin-antitoxin stability system